jgi:hypothetical protein
MLNLLIREDRHWLRREYLLRFALVVTFFIGATLFIWGVVISSLYIQLRVEEGIVKSELEAIKNSSDSQSLKELTDLNKNVGDKFKEINILNFTQEDIIREIILNNREGINISLISNTFDDEEKKYFARIEMRGVANTRSDLVEYQQSLESSELFNVVDIPFSSFAQNSEIPFTVNITSVELNEYFKEQDEK